MQCLIIAAGQGTRLRSVAPSKPLAEVKSVPLIEHVARMARAGGASHFLVVTGYEAEPLELFLTNLADRIGAPVRCVRNPDWHRANGVSILAAAPWLEPEFALLMSDHLFDPAILAGLMANRLAEAELNLAVDFDLARPGLDLDDATKVALTGGRRIGRIGKMLADYDAVDTGIFLATTALIEAIRKNVEAGGSDSLSGGVQLLADAGKAAIWDIEDRWWLDVDDEAAHRLAELSLPDFGPRTESPEEAGNPPSRA